MFVFVENSPRFRLFNRIISLLSQRVDIPNRGLPGIYKGYISLKLRLSQPYQQGVLFAIYS